MEMTRMKRFVALMLVAVLVVGICATAFAAKPTVTFDSATRNQKVKRGKTARIIFTVDSKSYGSYVKGRYYAGFDYYICRGSKNGPRMTEIASRDWSGKIRYNFKWKTKKSMLPGKYVNVVKVYYRNSIYSNWILAKTKTANMTLK